MGDDALRLRFRHTSGDLGPLTFREFETLQQVKEKLISEWPKDGPLSKETPSSVNDIKLIITGKFVENAKQLRDYRKEMGEIKADTIVTFHVVVRLNAGSKHSEKSSKDDGPKGCGCVIS